MQFLLSVSQKLLSTLHDYCNSWRPTFSLTLRNACCTGTNAPDFVLPSNTGKDISLKSLAGKRTVLYFYPVSRICSDTLLFSLPVDCSVCSESSLTLSGEKNTIWSHSIVKLLLFVKRRGMLWSSSFLYLLSALPHVLVSLLYLMYVQLK